MALYLHGKQAKLIDEQLAKYEITRGKMLGSGSFSNVYAIKGNKSEVLKLSVCPAQIDFLDRFAGSSNPHFPKGYKFLATVALYEHSGDDRPLYAYKVERLKSPIWEREAFIRFQDIAEDNFGCQTSGERSVRRIDETIDALKDRQNSGVPISSTLIDAMKDLKGMMSDFNDDNIILDLHQENFMMRGRELVISDPICDGRFFY